MRVNHDLFDQNFLYAMSLEVMQSGLGYTKHYFNPEMGYIQELWLDPLYMLLLGTPAWDMI